MPFDWIRRSYGSPLKPPIRVDVPLPTVIEPSLIATDVPPMFRLEMPALSSPVTMMPVAV
jgi:hypothetical protein